MTPLPFSHPRLSSNRRRAFTRLEAISVLAAIALLSAAVLPVLANDSVRNQRAVCINNLARIGQALTSWAADHEERYPWQLPLSAGGTGGFHSSAGFAWYHFVALSNELQTPAVMVCPADSKTRATGFDSPNFFTTQGNNYCSYLLVDAAVSEGRRVLSGDRNITLDVNLPSPRVVAPPGTDLSWDLRIHVGRGQLLFNDGTVEDTDTARMRSAFFPPGNSNTVRYYTP